MEGVHTMRNVISLSILTLGLLFSSLQPAYADGSAVSTMANIMIGLKHFPSDADKTALTAIVENSDSSDAEKGIAMAIANIQHKVTAADKEKLTAIAADEHASGALRKLAAIVGGTNHMPSAADIEKLQEIAAGH